MERSRTTRKNDAVTLRQFNRFLITANIPSQFKGIVKELKDVLVMPIILQDLLFAYIPRDIYLYISPISGIYINIYPPNGGYMQQYTPQLGIMYL